MYCKNCGKIIADDSKFCCHCGVAQDNGNNNLGTKNSSFVQTQNDARINTTESTLSTTTQEKKGSNRLLRLFFISLGISVICSIGYASIRHKDSQPCESWQYWGQSVYDPEWIGFNPGDHTTIAINEHREEGYIEGIKKTAIYSFLSAFTILVLGAIISKNNNKK